jgi:2-hydroxy-6-oxonona-2,4-dienedioate hydrolase
MKSVKLQFNWLKIDGCNVRYVDMGKKEGKAILFLHGLGGSIEADMACFKYLMKDYRIIEFDQPGSGYSDKPIRKYDLEYLIDFVFNFADKVNLDKFYVCGGSQGGLLALLCCAKKPDRIIKSAIFSPSGIWGKHFFLSNFFKILPPFAGKLFLHVTSYFWYSLNYKDRKKLQADAIKYIDSREMPGFGMHILGCLESVFAKDRRPIFSKIITPTLIFWGMNDYGQPIYQGRYLARIMPGSKLIEVPNAGHNVSTEKPVFFASEIKEFFER